MTSDLVLQRRGADTSPLSDTLWINFTKSTYDVRVLITPEVEGGYSVEVMRLPGIVSEGETLEEAMANIRDAFHAAASVYLKESGAIPWCDAITERSKDSMERRILVDV